MYPLVITFLISLLYPDDNVFKYSIGIVLVGFAFVMYPNLLMFVIIPESMVPCRTRYLDWFGFITIPFLSLVSYGLILGLLLYSKTQANKK